MHPDLEARKTPASWLYDVGKAYVESGQFESAIEYLRASLDVSKRIGKVRSIAECLSELGTAYSHLGNFAEAEKVLNESRFLYHRARDNRMVANVSRELGLLASRSGDANEAVASCLDSYRAAQRAHAPAETAAAAACLAALYGQMNNHTESQRLCAEAMKRLGEIPSGRMKRQLLEQLVLVLLNQNQLEEARRLMLEASAIEE